METVDRRQVIGYRWRAHQLDGSGDGRIDLLDFGVQDTGVGGAGWALAARGGEPSELLMAWTLRGAPHAYRRADAAAVAVATAPLSEADAAKRMFDASRPLRRAGIAALDALRIVAEHERKIVSRPTVKGELSSRLTATLDGPYLRWCRPCQATHCYEQPFRLAALQAGLELEPGTSPPILRRIPGFRPTPYAALGGAAQPRYHVVRNYLRFFGPARMRDAAAFLDSPVADVKANWPSDAVEVAGPPGKGWYILADDLPALTAAPEPAGTVRLVGPYDAYVQAKDRETLAPDAERRAELWPVLGRPGAVLRDGEIVGTWRPKTSGRTLSITVNPWRDGVPTDALTTEAERFAEYRSLKLSSVAHA